MSKFSDKEYKLFSLAFGILFLGFAAFCWMPGQEPIQAFHYPRAIGNTVIGIIFLVAAIRGSKGF
jgi:hypothetical protein